MNKYFNQKIKCRVNDCKYYTVDNECSLSEIEVNSTRCNEKHTFCGSYEKNDLQ